MNNLLQAIYSKKNQYDRSLFALQYCIDNQPQDVQRAIWVASIPHFFNKFYLINILNPNYKLPSEVFTRLISMPFVDKYKSFYSISESNRLLLVSHFSVTAPKDFYTFNCRSFLYFYNNGKSDDYRDVIESFYHGLLINSYDAIFIVLSVLRNRLDKNELTEEFIDQIISRVNEIQSLPKKNIDKDNKILDNFSTLLKLVIKLIKNANRNESKSIEYFDIIVKKYFPKENYYNIQDIWGCFINENIIQKEKIMNMRILQNRFIGNCD